MFNNTKVYFHPDGLIKARRQILENQVVKNGGQVSTTDFVNSDFVLIDDDLSVDKIPTKFRELVETSSTSSSVDEKHSAPRIVRTRWLSECIKRKNFVNFHDYEVKFPEKIVKEISSKSKPSPKFDRDDDDEEPAEKREKISENVDEKNQKNVYSMSTDSSSSSSDDEQKKTPNLKRSPFVCDSPASSTPVNHNKFITDKLQVLADGYKSTKDKWRAFSYDKAINVLKYYPKAVTSREEVKQLKGIGDRLAEKILEIVESGELAKADAFSSNEKLQIINLFNNIWGVGPTIAEQWFVQGFKTLEDVKSKAKLSHQQIIGLKYYNDFLQRMPRKEASLIVDTVVSATKEINADMICEACGSYRRGRATCGDVDILITHPDGHSHDGALPVLINNLTDSGFLTDHLVETSLDGNHKKYMGVCKVPGDNNLHRRIDIISVPYSEYPTSLVYFTGSEHFVRSIYAKAKSMGMRLNAHGLRGGIMRQKGEMLNDGYLIETPTERSVFEKLNVPYRTPAERDHPKNSL